MTWPQEPFFNLRQIVTPSGAPSTGGVLLYFKADGLLYSKNSAGVEAPIETALGDVTLNGVQTLTNKDLSSGTNTFPSALATDAEVASAVATHAALTVTHGATGAVVGTTNAQTVTNKVLSTGTTVGGATTDISTAWTVYTPTWTAVTVNNGTVVADYVQIGKTVHFRASLTLGSTTAFSGASVSVSLPVVSVSHRWRFDGEMLDAGFANYPIQGRMVPTTSTTSVELVFRPTTSLSDSAVTGAAGNPFAVGVGDIISISGTYLAA